MGPLVTLRNTLLSIVGGLALVSAALATPAQAADTPLQFTVTSGTISVVAPTTTVTLTSGGFALLPTMTGSVATTITDTRNSLLGWQVQGSTDNFASGANSVAKANVALLVDAASVVTNVADGRVFVPTAATGAGGVIGTMPVSINGALGGNNSVAYNLGVTVSIPAGTPAGVYTSVLHQTIV